MVIPTIKILIVDSNTALSRQLASALNMSHYHVDTATDTVSGLAIARRGNYDLVLLDLHLPESECIDFCRRLRLESHNISILLMTSENAVASRIIDIEAVADNYVLKPIDIDGLLIQVRSILHQKQTQRLPLLTWADIHLDPVRCEVHCRDQQIHLTSREYRILELLLRNPHRIFSLNVIVEWLWSIESVPYNNVVRAYIKSIQYKLKQAGMEGVIETVYGLGYQLGSPEHYLSQTDSVSTGTTSTLESDSKIVSRSTDLQRASLQTPDALRNTWERHCPKYLKLVASLSEAIPSLQAQESANIDKQHQTIDDGTISNRAVNNKAVNNKVENEKTIEDTALRKSQAAIHTLKGTLGSFGLSRASMIASQIEIYLQMPPPLATTQINQLETLIESLKHSLDSKSSELFETDSSVSDSSTVEPFVPISTDSSSPKTSLAQPSSAQFNLESEPSLVVIDALLDDSHDLPLKHQSLIVYDWLIIDSDRQMVESLLHQSSISDIRSQVAYSLDEARLRLAQHIPTVVTFDPSCAASWDEGLSFLAELNRQYPSLPVLVITEQDTLAARVKVVRSGGCTFLHKPVDVAQIVETVMHTVSKHAPVGVRIVALDDDPQMLLRLQSLLAPWGFQLTLLSEPTQLWQVLERSLPDLLILDLEMPQFNGLELCQVIRSDLRTAQIPILILSAHTAPEIVRRVFEVGADDYVSKPVVGPELISRILNRLERLRLLRKLAEIDSLTGLSRRGQSEEALERLIRLSVRQKVPLCMALLDLDNFKRINDCYGHDVGDQVLKIFGEYLRKAFRGEDVLARWGGEEFVVGLYNVSEERALQRLNELRKSFGQHLFHANSSTTSKINPPSQFRVSLSGGVATAPIDGEAIETLYRHADQALYRAKAAGRNQICTFSSGSQDSTALHSTSRQ